MKYRFTPLFPIFFLFIFISVFVVTLKAEKPADKENKRTFALPSTAVKVEDNLYYLGKAKDKDGREVEGYAIIHYKSEKAKGGGSPKSKLEQCYGFLADGAKWKTVEPWVVNPLNTRALVDSFVFDNLTADIAKWEDATDGVVGSGEGVGILGDGAVTQDVLVADTISPDNVNEVYFANVTDSNAIAVTIVWGIFSGPPFQRALVEWDQVYDDVDYDWSASGEVAKMDFENIATHELGHSVGMKDLYTTSCSQETMYGYASNGEIIKRDLNTGDIKGINTLY